MKYDIHTMVILIGEGRLYSEINYLLVGTGPITKNTPKQSCRTSVYNLLTYSREFQLSKQFHQCVLLLSCNNQKSTVALVESLHFSYHRGLIE